MPTPTKGPRLGGGPAHERLILANLATSLFEHDSITTTEAGAAGLRPLAERLITFAKRGDLHARRRVMTVIRDKGVAHRLFAEIGPDMAERNGGYTRITKIGARKGDNAPMAVIEPSFASPSPRRPPSRRQRLPPSVRPRTPPRRTTPRRPTPRRPTTSPSLTLDDHATDTPAPAPAAAVSLPEGAEAAGEDGSGPDGYTVKGNADSGLYHVEGSQWYDQTIAEFWFKDADAAEAAGFKPAGGADKQDVDEA